MNRRGSVLVGALLLLALLLLLGLASLSRNVSRNRTLHETRALAEARQLAQAGMADVRAKLHLDITFPPPIVEREQLFSYTEEVRALDGTLRGYYTVTLDGRYLEAYQMLRIRSVGKLGAEVDKPLAESRIEADFDVAPDLRSGSGPNPYFFEFRTWND